MFMILVALLQVATTHADELRSPNPATRLSLPTAETPFDWSFRARLFTQGITSVDNEDSLAAGIVSLAKAKRKFSDYLEAGAGVWINFQGGSTHALIEMNRVNNGLALDEAFVNLIPVPEHITISAGALNQRFLQNPLLVDEISFPGIQERFSLGSKNENFNLSLVMQQVVPTSQSLSTRTVEREPLPYFLTESLFATYFFSPRTSLAGRIGHFSFSQLPTQVALESNGHGNLVDTQVARAERFESGFSGYMLGSDIRFAIKPKVMGQVGIDYFTNTEIGSEYADGMLTFAQTEWQASDSWLIIPRLEYFRLERQASPAFYNSLDYGHNNRHGFNYEVRLTNNKERYAVKGRYTDAALIEEDHIQGNTKIFMVYLEIFHDSVR